MVCRFLQTVGASGGLSVGSVVIADIYKLEERDTAMGIFYGVGYFRFALIDVLICGIHRLS
jgi:MFS family permease